MVVLIDDSREVETEDEVNDDKTTDESSDQGPRKCVRLVRFFLAKSKSRGQFW